MDLLTLRPVSRALAASQGGVLLTCGFWPASCSGPDTALLTPHPTGRMLLADEEDTPACAAPQIPYIALNASALTVTQKGKRKRKTQVS